MKIVDAEARSRAARLRLMWGTSVVSTVAVVVGALAVWFYPDWRLERAQRTLSDIGATVVELDTGTVVIANEITGTLSTDDLVWLEPVRLRISNVGSLDLLDLGTLPNLETLEITDNDALTTLPELQGFADLEELTISGNDALIALPELQGLVNLERLSIMGSQSLVALPALQGLTNLQELTITDNGSLTTLPELEGLASLQGLSVSGNDALTGLPALQGLSSLQSLYVGNNGLLSALPDLQGLDSLERLNVQGNGLLAALPELHGLGSLRMLSILDNDALTGLPRLRGLDNLQTLWIQDNEALAALPDLQGLSDLRILRIVDNEALTAVPALQGLVNLELLLIGYNNDLEVRVPPTLRALPNLRDLGVLTDAERTAGLELSDLTGLRRLRLSSNFVLDTLPTLEGLPSFDDLEIERGEDMASLPELQAFAAHTQVWIVLPPNETRVGETLRLVQAQ